MILLRSPGSSSRAGLAPADSILMILLFAASYSPPTVLCSRTGKDGVDGLRVEYEDENAQFDCGRARIESRGMR